VRMGLLGLDEPVGRICGPRDLPEVLAQGHELGCHTFGHLDAWETEPRVFEESVLENRRALRKLVPGAHFETMSYPIACPRPATKQRIGRHFSGCRAGGQRLNAGAMDLNHLNAFFLEQARDRPRVIHDMIERNRLEKGWLIFATHDIARQPSRFGCTPEFFEDVVRRALASGARVLPVAASLADAAGIHRVGGLKSSAAG
jgi:peptidoglycan/xylan/chitin deacetylase (PgdA/CDA1 family)